jgi:hypothetical protein
VFALALFLRAYSLGGGTYTGLEAVSNNVHMLAEPRVKTGKWTMIYMAASLSFTAGGIILLYLLWGAQPIEGKTLNAVVFGSIVATFDWSPAAAQTLIVLVLGFEAGLLVVAANTGFLGGPAVLASMAADSWMPHQFRHLSNRLVTQNGVILMGICALAILLWTGGSVSVLVVLYSINVFLTFSLSLFGLCRYWLGRRRDRRWLRRFALSAVGFAMTSGILLVTAVEKFLHGGWLTLVVTGVVIGVGVAIRRHYDETTLQLEKADELYANEPYGSVADTPEPDRAAPTAVFVIGGSRGGGMYALKWVKTHFPGHFRNFVFISGRAVDANSYGGEQELKLLRQEATVNLRYYVNYCRSHGVAADARIGFGTDAAEEVVHLADGVRNDYPNCMFFTSKLVFAKESWFVRVLHNQTAMAMQSRLHLKGMEMMILPMRVA